MITVNLHSMIISFFSISFKNTIPAVFTGFECQNKIEYILYITFNLIVGCCFLCIQN